MPNYHITLAYDGSCYHGWEKQKDLATVQLEVENTLTKIFNKRIQVNCSGRTDSFVHAYSQQINFNNEKVIEIEKLKNALNSLLPPTISVTNITYEKLNFHARFSAISKTYMYRIYTGKKDLVFLQNYSLVYNKKINMRKIKKASKKFIGTFDFLSFSTSVVENTVRTVNWIKIKRKKNNIYVFINGNGFLRSMVRMIVGSLLDINENKKSINDILHLLKFPKKGSAITKIRGSGLYLYNVKY